VKPETTFIVRLCPLPGSDGIRTLRWALKELLRKYKLRCVSIEELTKESCCEIDSSL
jgi:hypothetical protein